MKPNRDTFNHEHRYKILLSKEKDEQKDEKEEEIEDITSYHVFGLGWSSDIKYNRKMIKVLIRPLTTTRKIYMNWLIVLT